MFTWFIARRLFSNVGDTKRVSRPAISIATFGVAIGVAIMLVSVSVVLGFQSEIRNKVFGFGSHIQILNYQSLSSEQFLPIVIDRNYLLSMEEIPGVEHAQRFCMKPGMLKTTDAFRGVAFRGVGEEYDLSFLQEHLVEGKIPAFSDSIGSNHLLLSQGLALQMNLKVGSTVYAYFFDNGVRARRFTVSGIYRTNLTDFDNQLVYTDLYTIHSLLKWEGNQCSGAELRLKDIRQLDQVMHRVVARVNRTQDAYGSYYTSMSIKDLYPQIFAWLSLLDMDVWVILILMVCVAGFTMISGLLIIILERTNFIGIMKAMGASNTRMRHLFLYFAAFIILRGMLLGNVLALALILIQKSTGIVHLDPETYYVDAVPVLVNWGFVALINVCTLLICLVALILPSYLVSNIHPARSIRFE